MDKEPDIVERLRNHVAITTRLHYAKDGYPEPVQVHGPSPICLEAADEIERLRAERDEARREVCGLLVACHTDPDDDKPDPNLKHIHAGIRGWDCFKENT